MRWQEIRQQYPKQWLLVEALNAHSESGQRIIDDLAVIELCPDALSAIRAYARLRSQAPHRELLFLHTDRPNLEIAERYWLGVRASV